MSRQKERKAHVFCARPKMGYHFHGTCGNHHFSSQPEVIFTLGKTQGSMNMLHHTQSDTTFHSQLIPTCFFLQTPDKFFVSSTGTHFNRQQQQQQQHSHATSCRHFQLGPQAPLPMDFPMPHPGQPQSGMNPHLAPPGHQHGPPLHPPLNPLPAPQFQDIPGPPFLPQALHQQYLLQQQILEAQHRHILPPSRYLKKSLVRNKKKQWGLNRFIPTKQNSPFLHFYSSFWALRTTKVLKKHPAAFQERS